MSSTRFSSSTALMRRLTRSSRSLITSCRAEFSSAPNSPTGAKLSAVSVWNVPLNLGQPLLGPDTAPRRLHAAGLNKLLHHCGWHVVNHPEFPHPQAVRETSINAKNCGQIGAFCKMVSEAMDKHYSTNDDFALVLGGDHSVPIGTLPPLIRKRPNTGIVWVDAHADINTPLTSGSGNVHGMPVAFLLGLVEGVNQLPGFEWFKPCLKPSDIVYIGLRDLDLPEKLTIKKLGIKAFTMHEVDKFGISSVMDQVCDYFKEKDNIHLSLDIDAMDPFFAPHTGTAVRGGLTFREGNYLCEALCATNKLTSMDLVELNPMIGATGASEEDTNETIEMGLTLIGSAMGQRIL